MLADLVIKNRKTKNELQLKKKARNDQKKRKARKQLAKKRRSERYEKTQHEKAEAKKEAIQKLDVYAKGAHKLAVKMSIARTKRAKKMAIMANAKLKAKKKESLLAGGVIHMAGSQLSNKPLFDLNKQLVKAEKHPTAHTIRMAKMVYDHAASKVGQENEHYKVLQRKRKAREKQRKENEKKQKASAKDRKVKTLKRMIETERRAKRARQEKVQKAKRYGIEQNAKKWHHARRKVNLARAAILHTERVQKNGFNHKLNHKNAEKARKAPMEAYVKSKQVVKERGHKLMKAKKASAKFIAKTMRERAIKRMKERGKKAHVKVPSRRRRISIRRRRAASWTRMNVRRAQIQLSSGYCLDASQRNRSGGKVHMWPCNRRNWNQQWDFNSGNGLIKNSHGICLDASQRNRNGGKVHMWGCNSRNYNQKWKYNRSNGSIQNQYGICLNGQGRRAGAKVHMIRCHPGQGNQKWSISGRL